MALVERDAAFAALDECAERAKAGQGGLALVVGEAGAGKTTFVDAYVARRPDGIRLLWGSCDPLPTPRPLGPFVDVAPDLAPSTRAVFADAEQAYDIFDAVFDDIAATPSIVVIDDLHWADQGTVDLLRFVLRRVQRSRSLVILTARDDEVTVDSHVQQLLGDISRSPVATWIHLPPLSVAAVTTLVGDRAIEPRWLHRVTAGNAFFVSEMLDHPDEDLPTSVRNAVLARTAGLDDAAWDLLYLLACSPEAIPDYLLVELGITLPPLRRLHQANLISRTARGVAFRHDLCRVAVAGVIPPGAEAHLHRRMIEAYEAVGRIDHAVITHHALGAGDQERVRSAATAAGRAAARSGAHRQAAEFYRTALSSSAALSASEEATLLELLAEEFYLVDQLDDAIEACRSALQLRQQVGLPADISAAHHAMSVYEWYNANRTAAEQEVAQAVSVFGHSQLDTPDQLAALGHGLAMQAYLAMQASDLVTAGSLARRAAEIAETSGEAALGVRVAIIDGICSVMRGLTSGRDDILSILRSAPKHLDVIYSSGYSNLTYLDVEERRLAAASDLLDVSIQLTVERDLPVCRVWQQGSRARLHLMRGDWSEASGDAADVLDVRCAPLARFWPSLVRGLVALRSTARGADDIADAWQLATRYGEPLRLIPAAAALTEFGWLTGEPVSLDRYHRLIEGPELPGLSWARGELASWLHRSGVEVEVTDVAEPYRLYLDGDLLAAADAFHRLDLPYEAALALTETGVEDAVRRGLDLLDGLGALAVADKVRADLRSAGGLKVPARRRAASLANRVGLTARQVDVLRLMGEGLTNVEMAGALFVSVKTIDHHVSAILAKLDAPNRKEAVKHARSRGILAGDATKVTGW
ncbi:regulatory LuxR family protein [Mycobacterium sp. BK086]|uniref:helix-turn-helix transcriptional regulator n=1 Tax=Mycobacterium sp. BK086 TaxID=2512165 RepID=UPI00105D53B6|nr:LuxR family transcriptional regulator [Mycobacterium sp. BK086]TDO18578.1 regulatory LuxR family protein [Mycobacterium sp. BK086]